MDTIKPKIIVYINRQSSRYFIHNDKVIANNLYSLNLDTMKEEVLNDKVYDIGLYDPDFHSDGKYIYYKGHVVDELITIINNWDKWCIYKLNDETTFIFDKTTYESTPTADIIFYKCPRFTVKIVYKEGYKVSTIYNSYDNHALIIVKHNGDELLLDVTFLAFVLKAKIFFNDINNQMVCMSLDWFVSRDINNHHSIRLIGNKACIISNGVLMVIDGLDSYTIKDGVSMFICANKTSVIVENVDCTHSIFNVEKMNIVVDLKDPGFRGWGSLLYNNTLIKETYEGVAVYDIDYDDHEVSYTKSDTFIWRLLWPYIAWNLLCVNSINNALYLVIILCIRIG